MFASIKKNSASDDFLAFPWTILPKEKEITDTNLLKLVLYISGEEKDNEEAYEETLEVPLFAEPATGNPATFAAQIFEDTEEGEHYILANRILGAKDEASARTEQPELELPEESVNYVETGVIAEVTVPPRKIPFPPDSARTLAVRE
ncbi:hypothetical protein CYMTET_25283 [Cymbomonas tetramitiformis]|uniref:Uncharacterized protein n=1 Tax=Cymbomonas tetramitiformis TaxID=36881 RepID=A0AAE0FUI3_9CHLO|nr:hypothetical protein CYMTET_25283 [Cymbomonas tetramitiformis]